MSHYALKQRTTSGFTLIELLVSISIIGLLSALIITNLVGARTRASDAKKKTELMAVKSALRMYYNDFQSYPDGNGLIDPGTGMLMPGAEFTVDSTTYMKALPAYYNYYNTGDDTYVLKVDLGNLSDGDLEDNYDKCCSPVRTGCPATLTDEFVLCED